MLWRQVHSSTWPAIPFARASKQISGMREHTEIPGGQEIGGHFRMPCLACRPDR